MPATWVFIHILLTLAALLQELATFDWSEGPEGVSVSVKNQTGHVFFQATMADVPIPRPLMRKGMQLAALAWPHCRLSIQWPIDDNRNGTQYADVPVYAVAQAAARSNPITPLQSKVCFDMGQASVNQVTTQYLDPVTWVGHGDEQLSLVPFAASFPAGAKATLAAPELLKCQAAADGPATHGSGTATAAAIKVPTLTLGRGPVSATITAEKAGAKVSTVQLGKGSVSAMVTEKEAAARSDKPAPVTQPSTANIPLIDSQSSLPFLG